MESGSCQECVLLCDMVVVLFPVHKGVHVEGEYGMRWGRTGMAQHEWMLWQSAWLWKVSCRDVIHFWRRVFMGCE